MDPSFAESVERLSEPGGYFDTDNLISNERSYLHVLGKIREMEVRGGAYIGVGPDQNFSYIAQIQPSIAFIIDIRRDNMLQQLLFKSLFELSRNRIEYLCFLFGRPVPEDAGDWDDRSVEELIEYIDVTSTTPELAESTISAVEITVQRFGVPLNDSDLGTIRRFHSTFIAEGPSLRFSSHGRPPRPYYPTYRQLLLETDLNGRMASYLAREEDFRVLRSLQERDLVIPIVGDLAGGHALAAIGHYLADRGEQVSAFYTSNVEFYLMREGSFGSYVRNVGELPHDPNSLIIRSYFGRAFGLRHPQAVRGYYSAQLLQTMETLLAGYAAGEIRSYYDLVSVGSLDLREASQPAERRQGNVN